LPQDSKSRKFRERYPILHAVFNPGPHIRRGTAGFKEEGWRRSLLADLGRPPIEVLPFVPQRRVLPERVLPVYSAWAGIESILGDIVDRFEIGRESCLEFGVERGYSTAALSCFFRSVTGVDTFEGDEHTRFQTDFYAETAARLADFSNIRLVKSRYQEWIAADETQYDLIHVDIIHTYADTFACGLWSARHSKCTLFHDTVSYPTVKRAVMDIARITGKRLYNFRESNGLGILV
jgi:hypothetical protein